MEKFKLQLEERTQELKPNQLRRQGKIPATLYGPGVPSENVQINAREFSRLAAGAHSHIVELQSGKSNVPALIRHVQREHKSNEVLNVEFYRVAADRKVTVTVPLKFIGVSPAVHTGGVFQENYNAVEIECLPGDIPENVVVDISKIVEVDHGIHFGELSLPAGVVILNPHEEVVCRVLSPKTGGTTTEEKPAAEAAAAPAAAAT
jgi:large subunit ribosomal protein L25